MSEYWERKVKDVIDISKEYGYPDYDIEFWNRQPAGVLSLIIDIYTKQTDFERRLKSYD